MQDDALLGTFGLGNLQYINWAGPQLKHSPSSSGL